eukprot:364348-Chlamydomonas_euryale.AAC.2
MCVDCDAPCGQQHVHTLPPPHTWMHPCALIATRHAVNSMFTLSPPPHTHLDAPMCIVCDAPCGQDKWVVDRRKDNHVGARGDEIVIGGDVARQVRLPASTGTGTVGHGHSQGV